MPLLPEQPPTCLGSIPVAPTSSNGPVTAQRQSRMLYRGSSACSSASFSSESLTSPSGPGSFSDRPAKDQEASHPSSSSRQSLIKKQEDRHDQDSSPNKTNNPTSSISSIDSCDTNGENTSESLDNVTSSSSSSSSSSSKSNNMLSADTFSNSSSSSSFCSLDSDEAPMLPQKSARRVSRLINPIPPKQTAGNERPMLPHAAPHQVYLSSEEDASSSADDFSDFADEHESDSEAVPKTTEPRRSREDTARMVAVIFHGKPSMVTLSRRSISPSSRDDIRSSANILRTRTEPTLSRPRSVSPSCSITDLNRPPRSSSMMTTSYEKKRPGFLQIDPFAKVGEETQQELARTPKTPTTMLRKTLNLVKKRSRPSLYQSEGHISPMEQVGELEEDNDPRESVCLEPPAPPPPVSYQDIMRSARRNTLLPVPRSEVTNPKSPKNLFKSGLSLGRQRSVRT